MSRNIDHGPLAVLGGLRCANPPYVSPWCVAVAGLILLTFCHSAYADPGLGRLFNTPAERSALDANRGKAVAATANGPGPGAVEPGTAELGPQVGYMLPPGVPGNMAPPGPEGMQPGMMQPGAAPGVDPAAPAAPSAPDRLEMNGVVRSSSGRSTVWLNNVPQSGTQNKFSNRNNKSLTVTLPSGKKILLRPGQRYDLVDGRVKDINEP